MWLKLEFYEMLNTIKLKTLCITAITVGSSALYANKAVYNIEDLRILNEQSAHYEFFDHAMDIRPSKRNAEWKAMVDNMGFKLTAELLKQKTISAKQEQILLNIAKWPSLKNNEQFIERRDQALLKIVNQCFKNLEKNCLDKAKDFHTNLDHPYEFSFNLLKTLKNNGISDEKLWPFVSGFVQDKFSEFYCHKEPLKSLITSRTLNKSWKSQKIDPLHPDCFKVLKPHFISKITSPDKEIRNAAYKIAIKLADISDQDKTKFYTLEFIDDNLSKVDMALALPELEKLSNDYDLREKLSNSFDPNRSFPGKIFSSTENAKVKTRVLYRHFPEYIDNYAKTCLEYLTGSKSFLNGNPTPDCHALYKLDKDLGILPNSFQSKYQKATKFLNK